MEVAGRGWEGRRGEAVGQRERRGITGEVEGGRWVDRRRAPRTFA